MSSCCGAQQNLDPRSVAFLFCSWNRFWRLIRYSYWWYWSDKLCTSFSLASGFFFFSFTLLLKRCTWRRSNQAEDLLGFWAILRLSFHVVLISDLSYFFMPLSFINEHTITRVAIGDLKSISIIPSIDCHQTRRSNVARTAKLVHLMLNLIVVESLQGYEYLDH
jgi:hypothetical protein